MSTTDGIKAHDNWLTSTPEGRLSSELGQIMNDVQRWRSFMSDDDALTAVYELIIAANELLPIVNIKPGEPFERTRYLISAAARTRKAMDAMTKSSGKD